MVQFWSVSLIIFAIAINAAATPLDARSLDPKTDIQTCTKATANDAYREAMICSGGPIKTVKSFAHTRR
jgi:hypothetical protein